MKVQLSKTKYCKMVQCKKILWLKKYKPGEKVITARESVFENGVKVGELAKSLFGEYENVEYDEHLNVMLRQTNNLLKNKPNIIAEACFKYENNFCSVDILKNDIDGVEIYEVKSSTHMEDIYLEDAAYQYYVLSNLGLNVKKVYVVYINSTYVKKGELELNKLFNIEDVTHIAKGKQEQIKDNIIEIDKYMTKYDEKSEPENSIGMHCTNPYNCEYWQYCTRNLPKPNVFDIAGMYKSTKFKKYDEGIVSFEDLQYENINKKYLEQIDFEINDKQDKIDKASIKKFINTLSYPIYFLDFETFQQAIPEFEGISPYMQIPFQYSLHYIEKEHGELKHKEFLAKSGVDPRRELAEKLVQDIPTNVCITAYNMGFEKGVIRKLAQQYPALSEHLLNITENIKDLMIPFSKRYYYTKAMQGSYSIKYVLPALYPNDPELDYHNLPVVHNGAEASDTFLSLAQKSKEEQETLRKGLLMYCKLDTYAMVKIWQKLKEVTQ